MRSKLTLKKRASQRYALRTGFTKERKKERKKGRDWYKQKIPDFRFRNKFNSCLWNDGLNKISKNFATSQNSRNFLIHLPLNQSDSLVSRKKVAKPFHLTQRSILNFVQINRAWLIEEFFFLHSFIPSSGKWFTSASKRFSRKLWSSQLWTQLMQLRI